MTDPYTADGGVFGPELDDEAGGSWGAGGLAPEGDETPPSGPLADGLGFIRVNEDVWRSILHSPQVVAAITERAQQVCDTANGLVAMDPRAVERLAPNGDPAYVVSVQNREGTTRARARIRPNPENALGLVDDAVNSNLLKAAAQFPSDPVEGQ